MKANHRNMETVNGLTTTNNFKTDSGWRDLKYLNGKIERIQYQAALAITGA